MKFANVKGFVTKAVLGATAAAALLFAAPTQSQAQVFVGVRFGRPAPVVVVPAQPAWVYVRPYGYGYYVRPGVFVRRDDWFRAHRDFRYR